VIAVALDSRRVLEFARPREDEFRRRETFDAVAFDFNRDETGVAAGAVALSVRDTGAGEHSGKAFEFGHIRLRVLSRVGRPLNRPRLGAVELTPGRKSFEFPFAVRGFARHRVKFVEETGRG
jgi:hypothetical protein